VIKKIILALIILEKSVECRILMQVIENTGPFLRDIILSIAYSKLSIFQEFIL